MSIKRTRFIPAVVDGVDVSDADALVGDVKDPKTFYSVAAPRKTGTMPTVAIVAANDDYPAGYHVGNVGGLDAIDADLAVGNIKQGVTIFGKVGTYSPSIIHDDMDSDISDENELGSSDVRGTIEGSTSGTVVTHTITLTLAIASTIEAGFGGGFRDGLYNNGFKMQLHIDGVQQSESAFVDDVWEPRVGVGNKACASGDRVVQCIGDNYSSSLQLSHIAGLVAGVTKL